MELKIDQEFKDLIPALSVDEVLNLEQSLLNEGCRDALVTWNGYLIDGHDRYAICTAHNLPYKVVEKQFDSRNDVCIWMINNQFARRNLALYVRGGLGLRLKEFYRLKAIENLRQSAELTNAKKIKLENTGSPISANLSNIPKINKIDNREEVSKAAGESHDIISKIEEIKTAPIEVISDLERKLILSHSKPFC